MRSSFVQPEHRKKLHDWSRLNVVLVRRMAQDLVICLLIVLKCNFLRFYEAMFHYFERPLTRIFYIPGIQKSDLDEVAEVMFT
jgi:hypothetical protein